MSQHIYIHAYKKYYFKLNQDWRTSDNRCLVGNSTWIPSARPAVIHTITSLAIAITRHHIYLYHWVPQAIRLKLSRVVWQMKPCGGISASKIHQGPRGLVILCQCIDRYFIHEQYKWWYWKPSYLYINCEYNKNITRMYIQLAYAVNSLKGKAKFDILK